MSKYIKEALPIWEECDAKAWAMCNQLDFKRKGDHVKVPAAINWFLQPDSDNRTYEFECHENLVSFDGKRKNFSNQMTNLRVLRIDVLPELKINNLLGIVCKSSETISLPEGLIAFKGPSSVVNKMKFPFSLRSLIVVELDDPLIINNLPRQLEELCISATIDFSIFKNLKYLSICEPEDNESHLHVPETVKTLEVTESNYRSIFLPESVESLTFLGVNEEMKILGGKNVKYMQFDSEKIIPLPSVESVHIRLCSEYDLVHLLNLKNLKEAITEVEKFYLNGLPLHGNLEQLENYKKEERLMTDAFSYKSDESDEDESDEEESDEEESDESEESDKSNESESEGDQEESESSD